MNTALTVVLCIAAVLLGLWILWNVFVLCILTAVGRSLTGAFDKGLWLDNDTPYKLPKIETRTARAKLA